MATRWCAQHGLLPREEAEAWALEQAQVGRSGAAGHWQACSCTLERRHWAWWGMQGLRHVLLVQKRKGAPSPVKAPSRKKPAASGTAAKRKHAAEGEDLQRFVAGLPL